MVNKNIVNFDVCSVFHNSRIIATKINVAKTPGSQKAPIFLSKPSFPQTLKLLIAK
jgi:hypothetical protein